MSAGSDVLRTAVQSANRAEPRVARAGAVPSFGLSASPEITSLARQVFLRSNAAGNSRVLFLGLDCETNARGLAEHVARALAGMQKTVSLVESHMAGGNIIPAKKPSMAVRNVEFWAGFQVTENFWRIPSSSLASGSAFGSLPFECVVLASSLNDAITPFFFEICDGVVLVLTAHKTHREAALRAKQMLEQLHVRLIGTVLDGRTFPIPEAIYKRL